jgi:hypothetical protein
MEKDEMFGGSGMQGEIKNAYTVVVRRTKGKRMLGRTRQKWRVNTNMDLKVYNRKVWIGFV